MQPTLNFSFLVPVSYTKKLEVNELFEEKFWIKIKLDKMDVYIRKYIV
jgi:hypothetical protein